MIPDPAGARGEGRGGEPDGRRRMKQRREEHGIAFGEALRTWARVGLLSFGGPAGQIAMMHRILVDEKRWISESRFLHALNYCMLLPGPEATQLATYAGWLLHGWKGGLAAGVLFVLPGFLAILVLSILYAVFQQAHTVEALFFGLKAATLAVVADAVLRIGKKVLRNAPMAAIAAAAFAAIFFFQVPFPLVVLGAGLAGVAGSRWLPGAFLPPARPPEDGNGPAAVGDADGGRIGSARIRAVRVVSIWLAIWFAPVALCYCWLGPRHVLTGEGLFFSKVAVVSFGGAYSVLAYVGQQAVEVQGWLAPGEMLDGLGMAETTPGPLIQVVQFVGFLGAYRNPEPFSPLLAALLASVLVTWVTFAPCFLWIFLGAPYIEHLRGNRLVAAGLSAITAAVAGVILNLSLWFALHVAFGRVVEHRGFGARLLVPDPSTANPASMAIAALSLLALLRFRWNLLLTLGAASAAGLVYTLLTAP